MAEYMYALAPVHHGRVENFRQPQARDGGMSRGMFNNMLAHMATKTKGEIVLLGAAGYFGARGLAMYIDQGGWLAKVGITAENSQYGRAGVCAVTAYALRNKQPIAAAGAGIAALNEVVGPWIDTAIYGFAHPEAGSTPATVAPTTTPGLPPPS